MKPFVRRAFAVCALVAIVGSADAAPDDAGVVERWRVGEVVAATASETSETASEEAVGGASVHRKKRLDVRLVLRCSEVDAAGDLVGALVRIDAWSLEGDGHEDRCLAGALIRAEPSGWTIVAADSNPSRAARSWLDSRFGAGLDPCGGLAAIVASGDSCAVAPTSTPRRLADEGLPTPTAVRPWTFTAAPDAAEPTRETFDQSLPVVGGGRGAVRVHGVIAGQAGGFHRHGRWDAAAEADFVTTADDARTHFAVRSSQHETWDEGDPASLCASATGAATESAPASERWSVGDACVETGVEHVVVSVASLDAFGNERAPDRGEWTATWTAEVECVDADVAGRPRVLLATLSDWKVVRGGERDESVAGATLRVSDAGFEAVSGVARASDAAKAWLRSRFSLGGRDDALRAAATPAMTVPGRSWRIDGEEAAAALRARCEVPVDAASVVGESKATTPNEDASGSRRSIEYVVDARVPSAVRSSVLSAASLVGVVHVEGRAEGCVSSWARLGAAHDTTRLTAFVPGKSVDEVRRLESTQVRDVVRTALSTGAQAARARTESGVAQFARGKFDAAIAEYSAAIAADERYARAWRNRGAAKAAARDFDGAVEDYSRAIAIDPRDAAAFDGRGLARDAHGDAAGAIADYSKAIEVDPGDAAALVNRGTARDAQGDDEGAAADWTKALEFDPHRARAHLDLARLRLKPGLPTAPVVVGIRRALELGRAADYPHLWLWLAQTEAGEGPAATTELTEYVASRRSSGGEDWYLVLAGLLSGRVAEDAALAAAKTSDVESSDERLCEAAFYAAMTHAVRRDVANALPLLDKALATRARRFAEYAEARRWRTALLLGGVLRWTPGAGGSGAGELAVVGSDARGPLARAGVVADDVVVGIEGAAPTRESLDRRLSAAHLGDVIRVDVVRAGAPLHVEIVLGTWSAR